MRIDKYLAEAGIGTRSEVKKLIGKGRVTIDGETVRDPGTGVPEGTGHVALDNEAVELERFEYYMLNKPAGILSASRKNTLIRGRKNPEESASCAVDLIRESRRTDLFPAGRLDKDTEGLLLITNDGQMAHRLLSPRYHVKKSYFARISRDLTEEQENAFRAGPDIGDEKPLKPCELTRLENEGFLVGLTEGRYHQIKRMFACFGAEVTYLKRLTFGPLALDPELKPGQYRRLTKEEVDALKKAAGPEMESIESPQIE